MAASNSMVTNVQESMLAAPNSSRGTLKTYAESVALFFF